MPILYGSEHFDDPQDQDDGNRHSKRDQEAVVFLSVFRFGGFFWLLGVIVGLLRSVDCTSSSRTDAN